MNSNTASSSSSVDFDEEFDHQVKLILELDQEAATLIQASTASSSRTRRANIPRDRVEANERLMRDYFCENPTYGPDAFRRRFMMSRELFKRIVQDLILNFRYFTQRYESRLKEGFTPIQKFTSAVRQLAYGLATDGLDDYLRMGEKTSRDCLHNFCKRIIKLYGLKYLRKPTFVDIQKLPRTKLDAISRHAR